VRTAFHPVRRQLSCRLEQRLRDVPGSGCRTDQIPRDFRDDLASDLTGERLERIGGGVHDIAKAICDIVQTIADDLGTTCRSDARACQPCQRYELVQAIAHSCSSLTFRSDVMQRLSVSADALKPL
jgi:hypothetical protein